MTTGSNADDELFVADFYPKLGEYLAERHATGYDAVAARARFMIWVAQHVDQSAIRPPRADPGDADGPPAGPPILVHMAKAISEIAVVERRLFRELGREPTPEELAAELGTSPD